MIRHLIILIFIQMLGLQVNAQGDYIEYSVEIFESSLEKEIFAKHKTDPFLLLQALEPQEVIYLKNWNKLLNKIDKKIIKSEINVQLLNDIFFNTHRYILKTYAQHANFSQTLTEGVYDCVTGTGALALVLDRYGIPYQIIETDEHVYIRGDLGGVPFIMESTFPQNGLILDLQKIREFERKFTLADVMERSSQIPVGLGKYESSSKKISQIIQVIGLQELAGLQYYNNAIKKFYNEDYKGSYAQLIKASYLYPSNRIFALKGKMEMLLGIVEVQ